MCRLGSLVHLLSLNKIHTLYVWCIEFMHCAGSHFHMYVWPCHRGPVCMHLPSRRCFHVEKKRKEKTRLWQQWRSSLMAWWSWTGAARHPHRQGGGLDWLLSHETFKKYILYNNNYVDKPITMNIRQLKAHSTFLTQKSIHTSIWEKAGGLYSTYIKMDRRMKHHLWVEPFHIKKWGMFRALAADWISNPLSGEGDRCWMKYSVHTPHTCAPPHRSDISRAVNESVWRDSCLKASYIKWGFKNSLSIW